MESESFTLKVLTPAGLVLEDRASSVTIPSSQGEIGVLPMHANYNGLLGTGILEYQPAGGGAPKRIVISQGFCSFGDNTLSILADYVAQAEQVNPNNYSADRTKLQAIVDEGNTADPGFAVAQEKLRRIEAIDQLIGVN